MQFQCDKELLEKSIVKVESIVPSRDTQTLLSNFLFTIEKDHISIIASDMESTVRVSLPAENTQSGEFIVRAKTISEISKRLNSKDFILHTEELDAVGEEPTYSIKVRGSGKASASYHMTGNARGHFPAMIHLNQNQLSPIPAPLLKEMIQKTFYSISQEDNRYIYNGLCFIFEDNKLTLVGTDGRRLSAITRELASPVKTNTSGGEVVVHARAIRQLQRLLDDGQEAWLGIEQRDIFFQIGATELASRLLEGKFPDYKKVIPHNVAIEFTIQREEFIAALLQTMVMSEPPSYQIRFFIEKEQMSITSTSPDLGSAEITLPINYHGEPLEIGFNASYILDILKALDCPTVQLGFNDATKPLVITNPQDSYFISLIMPMKIN